MTLVSQRIDHLLGGVSQQDERLRDPSQADEQINCLTSPAHGLMKRPPTEHEVTIEDDVWADANTPSTLYDNAFIHNIHRDLDENWRLVVRNGDLKVIDDEDGSEFTVHFPEGKSYLTGSDFRTLTVGNTTFLVNQDVEVDQSTAKSPTRDKEALVFVRQADYSTGYQLQVGPYHAAHITPAANNPESRAALATDEIMRNLHNRLLSQDGFMDDFLSFRYGSTLYIRAKDGEDFTLDVRDGMADKALLAVKDRVQRFEDLPYRARQGFTVEITGDSTTEYDNFWVVYDEVDSPEEYGVWRETLAPGEPTEMDPTTLPHELVLKGAFTDREKAEAPPRTPRIRANRFSRKEREWTQVITDGDPQVSLGDDLEAFLEADDDQAEADVPTEAEGNPTDYAVTFDVDTTTVDPSTKTRIALEEDDGAGNFTEIGSRDYESGQNIRGETILATNRTPASGSKIRLRARYSTGVTPDRHRRFRVNVRRRPQDPPADEQDTGSDDRPERDERVGGRVRPGDNPPPITVVYYYSKSVSFGPDIRYPSGYGVTLTVDGTSFKYTPAQDETGTEVAEGLQALIDANGSFTAEVEQPGEITVTAGDGSTNPTITSSFDFDESADVWLRELDMSGVDLTGATVRNITDGSEAEVLSHTTSTIDTDGLTGGVDNVFTKGDLVEIIQEGTYFVFRPGLWRGREVGDLETNPFPEFVDSTITDVGYYEGRLVFVFGDQVHFSAAGSVKNLFRQTAQVLRADDAFGVQPATPVETAYHAAIPWDQDFYLVADTGFVLLSGDPVLSAATVRADYVASFGNTPEVRPVVLGESLFFLKSTRSGHVQVREAFRYDEENIEWRDVTLHTPSYIKGTPFAMFGDSWLGVLVILTDDDGDTRCFVYRYLDQGRSEVGPERMVSSWSEWTFSGTHDEIRGGSIIDRRLGLVFRRRNAIELETIDLDLDPFAQGWETKHLDRLVTEDDLSSVHDGGQNETTFTLPYTHKETDDGTLAAYRRDTGAALSITRGSDTEFTVDGDLTSAQLHVGVEYERKYVFTKLYFRDQNGVPQTQGDLLVSYVDLEYHETADLSVKVTTTGRSSATFTLSESSPSDGVFRVPIMGPDPLIEIIDSEPGPGTLSAMSWEGRWVTRNRRA